MKTTFAKTVKIASTATAALVVLLTTACAAAAPPPPLKDAPIPTLTEYGDFQCGYCAQFAFFILPELEKEFMEPGLLEFEYRHLPILGPGSWKAASAAECAREQNRFRAYHDGLFLAIATGEIQPDHQGLTWLAEQTGLDTAGFGRCLAEDRHLTAVENDRASGLEIGARGTPTLAVDGHILTWKDYRDLKNQLREWTERHQRQGREARK